MSGKIEEAYELVDDGLITAEDFREFVFTNPLHFWTDGNRDHYGSAIEIETLASLPPQARRSEA
jgi:hypothetical protein